MGNYQQADVLWYDGDKLNEGRQNMYENEIVASNIETYKAWVSDISRKGKTPADMVAFARSLGFEEYADKVEKVISNMEELLQQLEK